MNLDHLKWPLVFAFTTLLFGCSFQVNTTVLATPNPFRDQRRFATLPVAYEPLSQVLVGNSSDDQEDLLELDGTTRKQWQKYEAVFVAGYRSGISTATPDEHLLAIEIVESAPFHVRPVLRYLYSDRKGIFLAMTIQITAPDGRVVSTVTGKGSSLP